MLVTMTDKELYQLGIIQRVIGLMEQLRSHFPAEAVRQIIGSMKRSAAKLWI